MRLIAIALACISIASVGQARSNMETTLIRDMEKAGVPESCIAKVTANDAAKVTAWRNSQSLGDGSVNKLIKDHIRRICER